MGCCNNTEEIRTVRLKMLRKELLYDVQNYAYVEADVMGEPESSDKKIHAQHQLADICEAGNVDRVNRMFAMAHAELIEILYPYTKLEPVDEEIDNRFFVPEEYMVELHVPVSMSQTTLHLLMRLGHEYMVYRVLADWLSITNHSAATNWAAKAEDAKLEIEKAKTMRRVAITRKMSPF